MEVVVISKDDFDVMKDALGFAWHEMNRKMSNIEGKDIPKELHSSWGRDFEKWFDLYSRMSCVKAVEVVQ